MNNKEELSFWIRLSQVENIGPKSFNKIISFLKQEHKEISDLFKMSIKELGLLLEKNKIQRVDPSKVLKSKAEGVDKLLNTLGEREIKVLTLEDNDYPKNLNVFLGDNAPPMLYAFGNLALLDKKSLAIVGSRHASEESINIAQSVAGLLVKNNISIVSGYAAGIDSAAHFGALKRNGATIIILPYGILDFKWKEPFNDLGELGERVLILSEFYPNAKWSSWSAMQRNKTVVGFSDGVFAVEFYKDGGTFDAILTAAKFKKPIFVLDNEENKEILQKYKVAVIYVDYLSKNLETVILDGIQKVASISSDQLFLF